MIIVTGATGHVGSELIARLAAEHLPVRAMTRRPQAIQAPPGVEVVYGDCDDPDSLHAAFNGADRAFLMSAQATGSAERPTHDLRLVHAARRAGIRHVVKLSVYDGGRSDDALGAWHREAEAAVTDSGLDWTLLRPGRFMSNALHWAPMIRRGDTVHIPFAHRPAASIDPADIAAIAAAALTTEHHHNSAYQLSGPEVLTPAEELRILAATLGRPLRAVEPTIDQAKAGMCRAGMTEPVVEAIVARVLTGDDGAEVLPTVEQLLGRPPVTFATWARNHAGAFLAAD
ncbi:MAG: nucleoside-diphosphate sugar epimerase [Dactylosporangium sp.]|jgi:uncharacterized protein YbjT (DUF2867 family)|nr:nucleoside-diphosphate sugar epimerase [Dactylosporangium sp.]